MIEIENLKFEIGGLGPSGLSVSTLHDASRSPKQSASDRLQVWRSATKVAYHLRLQAFPERAGATEVALWVVAIRC
jgi:hypothetical protein